MAKIMFDDKYDLTNAVLKGIKTQTRRFEKPLETIPGDVIRTTGLWDDHKGLEIETYDMDGTFHQKTFFKPRYSIGEDVAIAQPYRVLGIDPERIMYDKSDGGIMGYFRDQTGWDNKMYVRDEEMPHWIHIHNVRIESIRSISDTDIMEEGVQHLGGYYVVGDIETGNILRVGRGFSRHCRFNTPRSAYKALIEKMGGPGTWTKNPYAVVYDFKLIR